MIASQKKTGSQTLLKDGSPPVLERMQTEGSDQLETNIEMSDTSNSTAPVKAPLNGKRPSPEEDDSSDDEKNESVISDKAKNDSKPDDKPDSSVISAGKVFQGPGSKKKHKSSPNKMNASVIGNPISNGDQRLAAPALTPRAATTQSLGAQSLSQPRGITPQPRQGDISVVVTPVTDYSLAGNGTLSFRGSASVPLQVSLPCSEQRINSERRELKPAKLTTNWQLQAFDPSMTTFQADVPVFPMQSYLSAAGQTKVAQSLTKQDPKPQMPTGVLRITPSVSQGTEKSPSYGPTASPRHPASTKNSPVKSPLLVPTTSPQHHASAQNASVKSPVLGPTTSPQHPDSAQITLVKSPLLGHTTSLQCPTSAQNRQLKSTLLGSTSAQNAPVTSPHITRPPSSTFQIPKQPKDPKNQILQLFLSSNWFRYLELFLIFASLVLVLGFWTRYNPSQSATITPEVCYEGSGGVNKPSQCQRMLSCPAHGRCRGGQLDSCVQPFMRSGSLSNATCVLSTDFSKKVHPFLVYLRQSTASAICSDVYKIGPMQKISYTVDELEALVKVRAPENAGLLFQEMTEIFDVVGDNRFALSWMEVSNLDLPFFCALAFFVRNNLMLLSMSLMFAEIVIWVTMC